MGKERIFDSNKEGIWVVERQGESVIFTRIETDQTTGIQTKWEKDLGGPFWSIIRSDEFGDQGRKIFTSFWDNQPQLAEYTFYEKRKGFFRQIQLYAGGFEIGFFLEDRDFACIQATYSAEDGSFNNITIDFNEPEEGKEDFYIELIKDSDPGKFIFSAELLEHGGTLLNEAVRIGEEFKFRGFSYTISNSNDRISIEITNLSNQRALQIEFPENVDVKEFLTLISDTRVERWSRASEVVSSSVALKEQNLVS